MACYLESILWRSPLDVSLRAPDQYKQLLVGLVSGLRELNFDVVLGEKVRITLAERVRRFLESVWKRDVSLTTDDVCEVIDALLLGNDYNTGCRIVGILREGILRNTHPHSVTFLTNRMQFSRHVSNLLYLVIQPEDGFERGPRGKSG